MRIDIEWILRDRKVIDGLDHLGIELVSVNLYQAMLPGITNVTERARYYAFYPWTIHRFVQDGAKSRTKASWRNWFRALDFGYAVACMDLRGHSRRKDQRAHLNRTERFCILPEHKCNKLSRFGVTYRR